MITLPAKTSPYTICDRLADMTDGTFEVVAVEVFDHPEAEHVRNAAQFGGDRGPTKLGAWVLGRRDEVYDHLQHKGYQHYEEQYSWGDD